MAFPQTRYSMIDRIVTDNEDGDWNHFLRAYWGPMVAFARRRGGLGEQEAEDVVGVAVEGIIRNNLLDRWHSDRSAKLRTLLCTVIRYCINNRARINSGRQRLMEQWDHELARLTDAPPTNIGPSAIEDTDALYTSWVEALLRDALTSFATQLMDANKSHYFSVLYAKLCLEMPNATIATRLDLKPSDVDNHFRSVRKSLRKQLRDTLHAHMAPGMDADHIDTEIVQEWSNLSQFLGSHGGLEQALRDVYPEVMPHDAPFV